MSKFVYLNNKYIKFNNAKIHIEDRGFQFADGVYEVISFYKKRLIDCEFHLKRLKYSLNELDIKYNINKKKLISKFNNLILKNKIYSGIIYIQITRGVQSRDHIYKNNLKNTIVIYLRKKVFNIPNKKFKKEKAITLNDLRWKRRDIKSISLLPNIIAKTYAKKFGSFEAIFIEKGFVTEGSSTNVWIIKNNYIITHPSNTDILKGITREVLKNIIKTEKLTLKEKKFTKKQMYNADEVFITGSSNFVTPIFKIDNFLINKGKIGKITKKLAVLYFDKLK